MAATDDELIRRVLAGQTDDFRLLVDRHQGAVFRYLWHMVGNRHVAEDLAQEAFLAAYQNLPVFDTRRAQFNTWLFTIARNRAINYLSRAGRKRDSADLDDTPIPGVPDPLVSQEFFEMLDRALDQLPPQQKAVFVLAEIEELSQREIAKIEQISVGTVKSRLHRAKQRLRGLLQSLRREFECL